MSRASSAAAKDTVALQQRRAHRPSTAVDLLDKFNLCEAPSESSYFSAMFCVYRFILESVLLGYHDTFRVNKSNFAALSFVDECFLSRMAVRHFSLTT